jgi:hypothetical protein
MPKSHTTPAGENDQNYHPGYEHDSRQEGGEVGLGRGSEDSLVGDELQKNTRL